MENNEKNVQLPVNEQVRVALDGRTNRWLSLKAAIPEAELSRKMKAKIPFSDDELKRISDVLGKTITNPKEAPSEAPKPEEQPH